MKVELAVDIDDTLFSLSDFAFIEDPLEGPECFYPEMKLIFSDYTYVVSMWCTSVIKYKNTAPFQPSSNTIENDLKLTNSSLDYLRSIRRKHFGKDLNETIAEHFFHASPIKEEDPGKIKIEEDEEKEKEERELENEALGNEGWFEDTQPSEDELDLDESN